MTDGDGHDLFRQTVRRAVEHHTGPSLDADLRELGWHDALAADPRMAIAVLFECQGEANATSSAIGDVVAAALGIAPTPATEVVLPAPDRWAPPGVLDGERLSVRGIGTARLRDAGTAVVVAVPGPTVGADGTGRDVPAGSREARVAEVKAADVRLRPVEGMDPWLDLVEVEGSALTVAAGPPSAPDAWPGAVRLARLALAHELGGASRAMLALACDHARGREQFGRPIAAFQAVRHRLADALVAAEATAAAVSVAWDDPSPLASALAKAVAGHSARTVARHCQQVLAGMGFTAEHPFHRYLRRVLVLDELFGSSRTLTRAVGHELVDSRGLPAPPPL